MLRILVRKWDWVLDMSEKMIVEERNDEYKPVRDLKKGLLISLRWTESKKIEHVLKRLLLKFWVICKENETGLIDW